MPPCRLNVGLGNRSKCLILVQQGGFLCAVSLITVDVDLGGDGLERLRRPRPGTRA